MNAKMVDICLGVARSTDEIWSLLISREMKLGTRDLLIYKPKVKAFDPFFELAKVVVSPLSPAITIKQPLPSGDWTRPMAPSIL